MEEPKKAQPSDQPDASAGSLAYMPKPDGVHETPINIGKKSAKEERSTVAKLTDDLDADDQPAATPVKVGVNGKSTKPSKVDNTEKSDEPIEDIASHDDVIPMDHEEPSHGHNYSGVGPSAPSSESKSRGKPLLIVLLVIALIVSATLGFLYWQAQKQNTDLNSKLKDSLSSQTSNNSSPTTSPSPSTAAKSSGQRSIPELGLGLTQTDATNKISYRYRETVDTEKKIHKVLTFSSTDIIAAERAISNVAPKCTAEFAPLGTLTSYAKGDTYKAAKIETQKVDSSTVFQIGETYYVYDSAQSACSADKTVVAAVTADKPNVASFIKALEAN